ncbi:MAG: AAA family ATPase [Desulfobulbaceae bacterium]|nr:AAA family ATPase [Desulfobulbaceae bacterium]
MTNPAKLLLIGSDIKIINLPIKEVSLLAEGSLPAYGYNPGDFIELMAGRVSVENGRLEQCQTWLSSNLGGLTIPPQIDAITYGDPKEVYQIFRKRDHSSILGDGWFMFHQILPPEGRKPDCNLLKLTVENENAFCDNTGIIIIDDSGRPPCDAQQLKARNKDAWVIAMGISVAHWQDWANLFKDHFHLFCRLADLETTRMEMDSSVNWETIVAMSIRALRSQEVGLWDKSHKRFRCHILVEMYPHGLLYLGPDGAFFRHRPGFLPQKSSPRHQGSVPCYDTLVTSMLTRDCLVSGRPLFCRNYFYDFSKRVLANWQILHEQGYAFADGLTLPLLDFASEVPSLADCSAMACRDPYFIELPVQSAEFNRALDLVSSQAWNSQKKRALRSFFPQKSVYSDEQQEATDLPAGFLGVIIDVLHHLKEEVSWKRGFEKLRLYHVGNLRTTDPAEIDPVITLQSVMDSYVSRESFQRPLCLGVFGPPGSGKSFSVKEVARVVSKKFATNPFEFFEFNMTQFTGPEEINSAIEPIRASVAKGKVPIVFWDEFDCRYDGHEFGYLRYFLPSMQDGVTYVHGTPYNIGRAIFAFAGGVKASWEEMERLLDPANPEAWQRAKTLKIPDFMSRLRVVLDIDGIELNEELFSRSASQEQLGELRRVLLKRAFIIAHQMDTHWKKAARKTSGLLLRLLLAKYQFGARSIEAVIEASGASDRLVYGLPELIAPSSARIHAEWRVELEREVDQIRKNQGIRAVW